MEENLPRRTVPKWLKRVQQNSWEPEILLSGLVLIGLMQLPERIRHFTNVLSAETIAWNVDGILTALQLVVYVLITGLIIHLFLRSVWVGLIGLTYTFPKGIQVEKLGYQPRFKSKVERLPPLENQIIYLEKLCSAIFATCFFLMMLIIGTIISVALFVLSLFLFDLILALFGKSLIQVMDFDFDLILSILFFILVVDFASVGLYRRNRYLAKIFYPVHRLLGWITFSRFYRSIYYTFGTNIKRRYLTLFFALFIFVVVLGQVSLQMAKDLRFYSLINFYGKNPDYNFFSPYYADRNEEWQSTRMIIPSPIVSGRFLEVRLKHYLNLERYMFDKCDIGRGSAEVNDEIKLSCVNQVYRVYVDDVEVMDPGWMFYFHQDEGRKGFITFLDVGYLDVGRHSLEVQIDALEEPARVGKLTFIKE